MHANEHPDAQWFPDAGLGLFVHWGLSSVDGTVDLSWGMMEEKPWGGDHLPPEEYFALAEEFAPEAYDPEEWLAAARRAGAEYAVLTAKHVDGFALWPSEHGEFSTAQYLGGRDLVGEFVDACRRQGVRVGFYFGLGDWHHPDWSDEAKHDLDALRAFTDETRPVEDADELARLERYYGFVKGQVKELVTRYGRLDLLWFDVPSWLWGGTQDDRVGDLYDLVRRHQPGIVVNGRGRYTEWGDYATPERELPDEPPEGWWELCDSWTERGWGYIEDEPYRDEAWTFDRLARTVGGGGNFLVNVGPKADGTLPDVAYDRLETLSEWMAHSEAAVEGVGRGPRPPRTDAPVTRRPGTWYLHVLADHGATVEVTAVPEPASVRLLRSLEPVAYDHDGETLTVEVPAEDRESPDEVVAVSWPEGPEPE